MGFANRNHDDEATSTEGHEASPSHSEYTCFPCPTPCACPCPSIVAMHQETQVRSSGWEDPLEEEKTTYSIILAWEILWTEEPGGLQSMGSQRIGHDWVTERGTYAQCVDSSSWEDTMRRASRPRLVRGFSPLCPKVAALTPICKLMATQSSELGMTGKLRSIAQSFIGCLWRKHSDYLGKWTDFVIKAGKKY